MATSRTNLRRDLSQIMGDRNAFTTSSAGNGGGTTLISTSIPDIPEGNDDDGILNWFVICTSGTNNGETRRVSAYTASSGTVTVSRAFTGQVASGVTFELHRIDPNLKHQAINQAAIALFPALYLPVRDETLVVDNLITNGDAETYAGGAFTGWSLTNAPTMTQETSIVMHGSNSFKMVAGGSDGREYQTLTVNTNEVTGQSLHFHGWVYATAASTARLRLSFDGGSTFTDHDYHTGADQWEHQTLDTTVPSTATSIRVYKETLASGTAYFDLLRAWIRPVYRYTMPSTIVGGIPSSIEMQDDELYPNGHYTPLGAGNRAVAGRILRIKGMGTLSQPASESATMEVDSPQTGLIVEYAAWWLQRVLQRQSAGINAERWGRDMEGSQYEVNRLLATYGQTMAQPPVLARAGWGTERDGATSNLVLTHWRA